jgi:hypothetical protein
MMWGLSSLLVLKSAVMRSLGNPKNHAEKMEFFSNARIDPLSSHKVTRFFE